MLSLLRDLGIVSLGVAAAAYALNEGTELRNALAVAAVGIAFNLLVWVILLCRKRRAGGKEPARQAAAPRPEANGGGKPSAASASASATASATSSASVARSPSSPLGLRERLRRLYLVKNPRKLGEIEKLVARYGHREDALLAKLQKKYGGEPSDAEVAAAIAAGGNSVPAVASAAPIAAGGGAGGGGGSESVLAEPIGDLRALVEMMGGSPPDQVENMLTIRRMDKICEGFARVMDSMGSSMALARKDFRVSWCVLVVGHGRRGSSRSGSRSKTVLSMIYCMVGVIFVIVALVFFSRSNTLRYIDLTGKPAWPVFALLPFLPLNTVNTASSQT